MPPDYGENVKAKGEVMLMQEFVKNLRYGKLADTIELS